MRGKFLSGITFFFVLNVLIKPIWVFGIDMVVQNRVGADVYGGYFALLNITLMFAILLDMGINMSNTRNVAGDSSSIKAYFPSLFFLRILLFFFFALVVGATGIILGYDAYMLKLLGWMVVNQFLLSSVLFIRSYVGGLQLFKWDAFLSVADKFLMVVIIGFMLYGKDESFHIEYFIGGQTLAYLLALSIGSSVIRSKLTQMAWQFDRKRIKKALQQALPFASLILVMGLYTRLDGVMVERMKGSESGGMYAGAFRLLDIAIQIGVLYSFVLIPVFTRKLNNQHYYGTLMRTSHNLLLSISLSVAMLVLVFHQSLVHWFYDHATASMGYTLAILMMSLPAFYMGYLYGSALTAGGKTKILNRIALGGLGVNFSLNIVLIWHYAEVGAALATFLTQWTAALMQMYFARKIYRVRIHKMQWIALLTMALMQFISFKLLLMFMAWPAALICSALIAMVAPFAFGLINIKKLRGLRS